MPFSSAGLPEGSRRIAPESNANRTMGSLVLRMVRYETAFLERPNVIGAMRRRPAPGPAPLRFPVAVRAHDDPFTGQLLEDLTEERAPVHGMAAASLAKPRFASVHIHIDFIVGGNLPAMRLRVSPLKLPGFSL